MSNSVKVDRSQVVSDLFSYKLIRSDEKNIRLATERVLGGLDSIPQIYDEVSFLGIEVEVEGLDEERRDFDSVFWDIKEDGSLRNNGWEFVSVPIRGNAVYAALKTLDSSLRKYRGVDFSDRTSVHVHVNVRDMEVESLINMLLIYLVFETILYKHVFDACGKKRDDNIFCVPIGDVGQSLGLAQALSFFEKGNNLHALHRITANWRKYSGLNLIPIRSFGTIEFRHLGGISNPEKILTWINLLLSMKKYASEIEYTNLKQEILNLNTNSMYEVFTKRVFKRHADHILKYNVRYELEKGVILVKYLLSIMGAKHEHLTEEKFDRSSFKAFFEMASGKKLVEIQKKTPEEMSLQELENEYAKISRQKQTLALELSTDELTRGFNDEIINALSEKLALYDKTLDIISKLYHAKKNELKNVKANF